MIKLIKSYLKKDTMGIITVGILSICSVFLMIIGMSVSVKVDTLYEDKIKELNEYHIEYMYGGLDDSYTMMFRTLLDKEGIDRLDDFESVELSTTADKEVLFSCNSSVDDMYWRTSNIFFQNVNIKNSKARFTVKEADSGYYGIYVSEWIFTELLRGQPAKATLAVGEDVINLEIIGYVTEISRMYQAGINELNCSQDLLDYISSNYTDNVTVNKIFGVVLSEPSTRSIQRVTRSLMETQATLDTIMGTSEKSMAKISTYILAKDSAQPFIKVLGIAMMGFSILVLLVAVVSLTFIISTSINADVKNFGILRSQGYTTGDLRKSYLLLYGSVIGFSILIGLILGIALMPAFVNVITTMSRLIFDIPVFAPAILVAVIIVLVTIMLAVYLSTRKLGNITPLHAVRRNISIHTFKHNRVPLDKVKTNVNVALGLKSVCNNVRQSVVVAVMILIICILSSFVSVVYHNLNVDKSALINLSGIEQAELNIMVNPATSKDKEHYDEVKDLNERFWSKVLSDERVEKYVTLYQVSAMEQYYKEVIYATALDYNNINSNNLCDGRWPSAKNEIVVPIAYANEHGLGIGDMIRLDLLPSSLSVSYQKELMIVGMTQTLTQSAAMEMRVSIELIHSIEQEVLAKEGSYVDLEIGRLIYLNEPFKSDFNEREKFARMAADTMAELCGNSDNTLSMIGWTDVHYQTEQTVFNVAQPASEALTIVFVVISVLVILLLLAMILKIKVMKEGEDYAIMKALGYTSTDIMLSITVSLLTVSVVASIIGCILGGILTMPLLNMVGAMFGVVNMGFTVNWLYMLGIFAAVNIVVFTLSMLLSLRIRRISAIKMIRAN